MDFGALPPEVNSARMYAGPGSESLAAAAAGWNGLAAQLNSTASSYRSVISGLTDGPWVGPSSTAMEGAVAPYVAWMTATAGQAEHAAGQAQAAAGAYETAFAMTVAPPVIAANRIQLASLTATNVFGQNTSAIATLEAQYGEMWAQDAAAMYGYAGNSAAASQVTPFTEAPQTASPAGTAAQSAAVTQSTGTAVGNSQASLSGLISQALQSLASPAASSTATGSGLSGLLSELGLTGTAATTGTAGFGGIGSSVIGELLYLPAFFGAFVGLDALSPIMGTLETAATTPAAPVADGGSAGAAEGAADGAGGGPTGTEGGTGSEVVGDYGAAASVGDSPTLGALSVPPSWLYAAAPPSPQMMLPAGVPFAPPGADFGAGLGFPFALPGVAALGAAASAGGAAATKYGKRLKVVARAPEAGYAAEPAPSSAPGYPVPAAAYPTNGHAPAGYRPAIVYLPTNGHEPASV